MKRPRHNSRGFTLVEIMIVAALIAILSSIAIFSINEFFNIQIRKATIGEARQLATSLSFAHDDLTFFPRFNYLSQPGSLVLYNQATDQSTKTALVTAVDYYGLIPGVPQGSTPFQSRVAINWGGPYHGLSDARQRSARGGRSGIVKVRLPEVWVALASSGNRDRASLVDYPADVYGQPYVFYALRSGVDAAGNLTPEFVTNPTQEGDYLNAVVSYGKNGIPGGNDKTPGTLTTGAAGILEAGALYVKGDLLGSAGPDVFTLRTCNTTLNLPANLLLQNYTPVHEAVLNALYVSAGSYNIETGYVGMLEVGTDDIVIRF